MEKFIFEFEKPFLKLKKPFSNRKSIFEIEKKNILEIEKKNIFEIEKNIFEIE